MSERGFDLKRDGTGILIFSVAAFFAVLIGKAWTSESSLSTATGTAVLADVWVSSLGVLPSLLFTAGLAFVGARLFLRASQTGWVHSAGALALTAVALSILLGAFSESAGGRLGAAIGGSISSFTHVSVGVIVGLSAVCAAVWIGWLRPSDGAAPDSSSLLSAKQALKRDVTDGVTRDEALALLPEDLNQVAAVLRKLEPTQSKAMPLSPYPEDVRLRGEIPAGAKPLQSKHVPVEPESAHEAHSVYRWTAPGSELTTYPPGADLARAAEPDPEPDLEPELEREPDVQALSVTEEWQDEKDLTDEDRFPIESAAEEVAPLPMRRRPSWEQANLFEAEDEPVDAYGTPLTLVESLRAPEVTTAPESTTAPGITALDEEIAEQADEDEASAYDDSEEDDDGERAAEADEDEADEDEADEDEADEDEDEEERETQGDLVEEVRSAAESSDGVAEAEWDEDDEEDDAGEVDDDQEQELEAEPLLAAELSSDVEIPSMVAPRERPVEAQSSRVFDAIPMRDVVLQPKVAPAIKSDRTRVPERTHNDLLAEAGCLFLDRGRVAVSMLQREYSMDFDEACALLDELQEMGLLGPYLGGQRRDILMTRAQWLEKVGARADGQASRLADV